MALQLLDLPVELLIRVMFYLDMQSLKAVARVNRQLAVVASAPVLKKHYAMITTGMRDASDSTVPPDDVLDELNAYEYAWRHYKPLCSVTCSVPRNTVGLYELSGGYMFLGAAGRRALHYMPLPMPSHPTPQWSLLTIGENIVDFALALYEHNLVVAVTSHPDGQEGRDVLEIRLIDFPSGRPHPLAKQDRIFLCTSPADRHHPFLGIEVVGDTMIIATHYSRFDDDNMTSTLSFWDWKQGVKKMSFDAPKSSYTTFIFLTEDIVLVPNATNGTLEYWRISTTDTRHPAPLAVLHLPPLRTGVEYLDLACRAEPNPRADVPRAFPDAPPKGARRSSVAEQTTAADTGRTEPSFYPAAEDAICVFQVHLMRVMNEANQEMILQDGLPPINHLVLVVHRSAFTEILERLLRELKGAKSDAGSSPEADARSTSESPASSTEPPSSPSTGPTPAEPPSLPWSEWGPPVSRWLDYARVNYNWITTSCGQRMVATPAPEVQFREGAGFVDVYDFNPYTVEKMREVRRRKEEEARLRAEAIAWRKYEMRKEGWTEEMSFDVRMPGGSAGAMRRGSVEATVNQLNHEHNDQESPAMRAIRLGLPQFDLIMGEDSDSDDEEEPANAGPVLVDEPSRMRTLFEGRLESQLPYIKTRSPNPPFYSGVMADHRRIIGMKQDGGREIEVSCFL
ncbi:hypothetical protein EV715DRAFT_288303 [Schizophyllum commune]